MLIAQNKTLNFAPESINRECDEKCGGAGEFYRLSPVEHYLTLTLNPVEYLPLTALDEV